MNLAAWSKLQSAVARRDDAQLYPCILLNPNDEVPVELVEEELDRLQDWLVAQQLLPRVLYVERGV